MKIERVIDKRTRRWPAEVYYTARARASFGGKQYWATGWGSTPRKAFLNWLYQAGRRRNPVE